MDFTKEQLQEAREYAATFEDAIANDLSLPEVMRAIASKTASEIRAGKYDDTYSVAQRMYYFLTGNTLGFLG